MEPTENTPIAPDQQPQSVYAEPTQPQAPVQTPVTYAAPTQPSEPAPDVNGPTAADEEIIDPSIPAGQHQILIIRRHPFGLVAMYLQAALGTVLALFLLFFLVPAVLSGDAKTRAVSYLLIFSVVAVTFEIIVLIAATYIYRQSRWVVTDDSVHQILQRGLFSHQTSELSMANIEDVTADQKGILAELFGFGTLKAETAGELPYFHFNYCPTPDKYAKIILNARERFINESPEEAKRANDLLSVPGDIRR